VTGSRADRVLAFARRSGDDVAVAVVPRATVGLAPVGDAPIGGTWEGTEVVLPAGLTGPFVDRVTRTPLEGNGGSLRLDEVLGRFPVALLTSWR
jgi:(1->4)-alpha-D-glucan 1-alpha-D-glucosylmutase